MTPRSVFFGVLAFSATVAKGQMYGVDYDTGRMFRIDPANAGLTLVASTNIRNLADLVLGQDNQIYGYTTGDGAALYKFNPTTWASTRVGALGQGFFFEGALAIKSNGDVYGANFGSAEIPKMFRLDLATGAATIGPQLGFFPHDFNGMTFRANGDLVGIDREDNALKLIGTSDGSVSNIANLAPVLGEVGGMTIMTQQAYFNTSGPGGVLPGSNELYRIDLTSGATVRVGAFDANLINGTGISGIVALVPEPSSLTAFAALLILGRLRRNRTQRTDKGERR